MSDVVKDIVLAFEQEVATILPTYSELDFKWDVTKNSFYGNKLRYGVTPGTAFNSPTTLKAITLLESFNLTLTNEYVNIDNSDVSQRDSVFELYDALNEVYKVVVTGKLGIPSQVFDVNVGAVETVLFIEDSKVSVLVCEFIVQYRTPF